MPHWGMPSVLLQRTAVAIVYTDHANLIKDALGMTLDRLYQWRLLLEEYRHKIVYIKGMHNTVADAISWLGYDPSIS
jgi:hypothetical protein